MNQKRQQELLEYYWDGEPIHHPSKGRSKPQAKVIQTRIRSCVLLSLYLLFSHQVLHRSPASPSIFHTLLSIAGAAYVADLISGMIHMYIDFGVSDQLNPVHKLLFLSRVHHHEPSRPAKLDYASLWYPTALYSFLIVAVVPVAMIFLAKALSILLGVTIYSTSKNYSIFWVSMMWWSSISQVSHAFAHGKAQSRWGRMVTSKLQGIGLLLSPRVHGIHHREIGRNFSILNGWANPLLNAIFKGYIESRVSEVTAAKRQKADIKRKLSYPYAEILS